MNEHAIELTIPAAEVLELTGMGHEVAKKAYLEATRKGWVGPPALVHIQKGHPPRLRDGTRRLAALASIGDVAPVKFVFRVKR